MIVPRQQTSDAQNLALGESAVAQAPSARQLPAFPTSWYLFGSTRELRHKPVSKIMWGRRLVCYRTSKGIPVVLDGQCCHLGADLGGGRVVGEALECPFHNWRFGPNGRCQHIPATSRIPDFAKQTSFPVVERHGLIFIFRGTEPSFALPFFPESAPEDLSPALPFTTDLDCPWYLVGANAFDLQHFRAAHDRRLIGQPMVDCPAPFARRATALFSVASNSFRDRLTRGFAGDRVEMSITDWCGNLLFVTATFRRTRSYGMVATQPLETGGVRVTVVVFVPRSKSVFGRSLVDPLNRRIRRYFIREFLRADAERLQGARYNPGTLIEADQDLANYFHWLSVVAHGRRTPCNET